MRLDLLSLHPLRKNRSFWERKVTRKCRNHNKLLEQIFIRARSLLYYFPSLKRSSRREAVSHEKMIHLYFNYNLDWLFSKTSTIKHIFPGIKWKEILMLCTWYKTGKKIIQFHLLNNLCLYEWVFSRSLVYIKLKV